MWSLGMEHSENVPATSRVDTKNERAERETGPAKRKWSRRDGQAPRKYIQEVRRN